jgi:hypothetical protein
MIRPSKAAVISAMEDMDREGCPMDAEDLAAEFGVSTSDIEQILSEEDEV